MHAEEGLLWKRLVREVLDRVEAAEVPSTAWVDRVLEGEAVAAHFREAVAADASFPVPLMDRLRRARSVRIAIPDASGPVRPELVDAVLSYVTAFVPVGTSIRALVVPEHGFERWSADASPWPPHLIRLASWEIPIDTDPRPLRPLYPKGARGELPSGEVLIRIGRPYRGSMYRTSDPDLRLAAFVIGEKRMRAQMRTNPIALHPADRNEPWYPAYDGRSPDGAFCVYETNTPSGYRLVVGSPCAAARAVCGVLQQPHGLLNDASEHVIVCADDRPRYLSEFARMFRLLPPREEGEDSFGLGPAYPRVIVVGDVLPLRPFDKLVRRHIWDPTWFTVGKGKPAKSGTEKQQKKHKPHPELSQNGFVLLPRTDDLKKARKYSPDLEEDFWLAGTSAHWARPPGVRSTSRPSAEADYSLRAFPSDPPTKKRHSNVVVISRCGRTFGTSDNFELPPGERIERTVVNVAKARLRHPESDVVTLVRGLADANLGK